MIFVELVDREHLRLGYVRNFLDAGEAFLQEDERDFLVDVELVHEQAEKLACLHLVLLVRLLLGHDVDLPLRELTGQAHVLTATADGLRQLLLVDRHVHRPRFLVDDDRDHLGRRHRVDDVLGGILVPQDDVHTFARKLVRDGLHPGAAHSHAGAYRIDARDVAPHADLRPRPRIPRAAHDLDQSFGDLRHFEGEQLHHEFGRRPADEQLRSAGLRAHVAQIAAEPISRPHDFSRDDLVADDDRLGVSTQVQDDAASLQALDDTRHHLADPMLVRFEHLCAFRLAHFLHDDLLGRLRRDPAEGHGLDRLFDELSDFELRRLGGCVAEEDFPLGIEDARPDRLVRLSFGVVIIHARWRLGEQFFQRGLGLVLGEHHRVVIDDFPSPERSRSRPSRDRCLPARPAPRDGVCGLRSPALPRSRRK